MIDPLLVLTEEMKDSTFLKEVLRMRGGEKVQDCIQCGVCSGSCCLWFAFDYSPMQIMKMITLGLKDLVLSSSVVWICAECYNCATRCPRGIDIPLIMAGLKNIALREGRPCPIEIKPKFYKGFLDIVTKYGRMHEPELTIKLIKKTSPRDLLHNAALGLRLLRKGKIKLRPSKIEQINQIQSIIKSASEEEDGQ